MRPFGFQHADSPDEAVAAVAAAPGAGYLGGGTNLVDLMKLDVERPTRLVDLGRLGLDGIEETPGGGLRIGATARNSTTAVHPAVRQRYPVLSEALLNGASPQLRHRATVGGNLLQRTRCLYFQDTGKPCNKREPGTGCPAVRGEHRELAVLGWSEHCVATHPSDMAVAMAALDAEVEVLTAAGGRRTLPVTELHRLPGDTPERDTVLEHGDLITAVRLPPPVPGAVSAYRKVRDRASYAFALVSVAAVLRVEDGVVAEAALAFGGVAAKPWRARIAEEALRGGPAGRDAFRRAVERELAGARPLPDNEFKVGLAVSTATALLDRLAAEPTPGAGAGSGAGAGR
ncbi:FAD binding domain-containing protein [Phaeacidiphilus oryzae]|uniref:FAD binding domain-containing protein n=1 Tax=Phaeacidiphilus oryzae TaxID=348818 RepID=UPI000563E83A|nr:xanthine dehydrogenase family protein subunit M [Phaeacidiphilus oryzae]